MRAEAEGTAARACPRTGRTRAAALAPGATRPSDALTAFLVVGVAWLVAAAASGIAAALTDEPDLRWLALHLAFVGGVSQLVVGAAQFFACAFLATEPVSRATVRAELALWNVAVVAIAIGVPLDADALTGLGGMLVVAGLTLFADALRRMRKRSLQRAPWATRWYMTAALFLACGAALGPVIGGDVVWTHGSLLGAHLVLNLGGWFGTAIVGTLHTFFPSLTQSRLRWPRLQQPTYGAWCAGIAALALSAAYDLDAGAIAGWGLLLAATAMLGANLLASARTGELRSAGAIVVGAGQLMLVAAVLAGLRSAIDSDPFAALLWEDRTTVAALLLGGWIGLTVAGSLLHLLALMERVRLMPRPPRESRLSELSVGAAAAVVCGLLLVAAGAPDGGAEDAGWALVAAGYALLLARIALLASRALRAAPLRL
jgi:nitrite reductase (NO-forming)